MEESNVDGDWLRSLGAVRPMQTAASNYLCLGKWVATGDIGQFTTGQYPITVDFEQGRRRSRGKFIEPETQLSVFGVPLWTNPTREEILLLCRALRVEVCDVKS